MNYPWLIENQKPDNTKYYFSHKVERFFYQLISFKNSKDQLTAILLLKIRDNNITVPYIFSDNTTFDNISSFLIKTMKDLNLDTLTTFNKDLGRALSKKRVFFLFVKQIKKTFIISKRLRTDNLSFQDGDGDCVFY
jgi:hypothetical protein